MSLSQTIEEVFFKLKKKRKEKKTKQNSLSPLFGQIELNCTHAYSEC